VTLSRCIRSRAERPGALRRQSGSQGGKAGRGGKRAAGRLGVAVRDLNEGCLEAGAEAARESEAGNRLAGPGGEAERGRGSASLLVSGYFASP
jgi:hypothetical protein